MFPVFAILGLVICVSVLVLLLMQRAIERASRQVAVEDSIVERLDRTLSTMKDAETGQRGFLLTHDEKFLEPSIEARRRIQQELDALDAIGASGALPAADVRKYRALATAKLAEMDSTVALLRAGKVNDAIDTVRGGAGKKLMDDLRDLTEQFVLAGRMRMNEKRDRASSLIASTDSLFGIVAVFDIGFLLWAWQRLRREIALRNRAVLDAQRRRELLHVTLRSIGDGVIVAGVDKRITFLNDVAARLTGWSVEEALGRSCDEVFRIVNESTRQPVESPVDRVLQTGLIVGLANHTLLISRDGREIPIDDSGAPIREADGMLRGVVLVFRDFSEHKHAEYALRLAMEDARAANVAKDNFLATLSHELRTPLTPVVMTLAEWAADSSLPAPWREDIEMMRRNLDLEARLIDDLLDLTRIVRGKLLLNPSLADVDDLLQSVAGMYHGQIEAAGLKLTLRCEAKSHRVFADPSRLQQVFLNILRNAVKFTPRGGAIDILTESGPDETVSIHFHDTGRGMSAEMLARLFLPFEQEMDESARRYGGLGLGMAISKALMEAQGGSIAASSGGPGLGSTFSLTLPVVDACHVEAYPKPESVDPASRQLLKILLVEDHEDTARALKRLLERWGHQVSAAHTKAQAIQQARAVPFDMLLSDIGLPDGSGVELIREIRTFSRAPAIALSGFGMEEDVSNCRDAGLDEHITKPIDFEKLETMIQRLAASARP